jgi:hypothetical protein
MSKTSILRSIKAGRISAGRNEFGQWAIEPCELHRVYPALTDESGTGNGTVERGVTGGETALAEANTRATLAEARLSDFRSSSISASNGTGGSSRRNGWRHSRSRISGRNPHPRSLSRGGECSQPPPGTSCFYGSWASSVGAFCFQLFVDRFRDPGACSATVTFELDRPGPISPSFLSRSAWASTALSGGLALSGCPFGLSTSATNVLARRWRPAAIHGWG